MTHLIGDNLEGCWKGKPDSGMTCVECYYNKVSKNNTWKGPQKCFDSSCLKNLGESSS